MQSITLRQWMELVPYVCFAIACWAPMIVIGLEKLNRWYRAKKEPPRTGGGLLL